MQCILIKDDNSRNSACALGVNVGSLYDPLNTNGVAHLTEHMIFMGSYKYPDESHYGNFLAEHGGYHNGMTGEDKTIFYYEIDKGSMDEALDIFAAFIKDPIFDD